MYDVRVLQTPDECRTVMERARAQDRLDVYNTVFARLCELEGTANEDPSDPLVRDFYETLAAYEQLLTEKNGRRTPASRTRQKIQNKGIHQSLLEWTLGKTETNGFDLLVDRGMPEYTAEYLVLRYAGRFPDNVVTLACERFDAHGIPRPDPTPGDASS